MHFCITIDRSGGWEKHKWSLKVEGNYALVGTDKYLSRIPNMKFRILQNIYEVVCESRLLFGAEMWGLGESWEEIDVVKENFCKKGFKYTNVCHEQGSRTGEMGRESRRGKILYLAASYWCRVRQMGKEESEWVSYEWQKENIKFRSWVIRWRCRKWIGVYSP
jgi:hypothetical protein